VPERVSTKSLFVVLIIGNSKSFHLGAQGTLKVFNCSNTLRDLVKIDRDRATFLEFLIFWFLKILEFLEKISTVQMRLLRLAFKPLSTVQTVQPERITYLLEQLLGGGIKEP